MTQIDPIVIVSAVRTAIGGLLGQLKDVVASELGATTIRGALQRTSLPPEAIEGVNMGCVLSAGQGQAPARQAALGAGLPNGTDCTTVNKMCGSGMKAIMLACQEILTLDKKIMIAGGLENMSCTPYLLPKARAGYRLGHQQVIDHLFLDGLEDAYHKGKLMGYFAENTAQKYQFTREQQDEFAIRSTTRAQHATQAGIFAREIVPVRVQQKTETIDIQIDQQPQEAKIDKIPHLKPVFKEGGTVTAANSSSISDGAAAIILMRESECLARGLTPLAKIVGFAAHSQEPEWFTTAPVQAIKKCLQKIQWTTSDVDLYEINEAFAVVTMAAMKDLDLPADKVNVHGGACALGHPIGASGARIIVTLLNALREYDLSRGIASLCIGGGEATAIAVELYR
jgi:acetyl-CoA C-acetyltransferase